MLDRTVKMSTANTRTFGSSELRIVTKTFDKIKNNDPDLTELCIHVRSK